MRTITAPEPLEYIDGDGMSIFLAGSIEMDTAAHWQTHVIKKLRGSRIVVFNPRRKEWDSSWEQTIDNPVFVEQVTWELDALKAADEILMYFDPKTKSPITLLELGLHAESNKLTVICPEGYWRKGNVDIVCKRHRIKQMSALDEYIEELLEDLKK